MTTVGEMVEAILGISDWASRDSDCEWASALKSLGIWDAEVLEGKCFGVHARLDSDPSFEGTPIFSDLDAWFQHNVMSGKREGRFRLIVLPCKEEK